MDPFVQQLAELCRAQVTRSKWVFVPSHAVGRTIGERIALSGTNWLNLRLVTLLEVGLRQDANPLQVKATGLESADAEAGIVVNGMNPNGS